MKKLMIFAVAAMFAASAFAQNPDALKQIKKAKSLDEVTNVLASSESSMSAVENAQAYNKCVDLCMNTVSSIKAIKDANQVAEQMGQEKKPVDEALFNEALISAYGYALKCDQYDVQPNEKGQVKPKFRKPNSDRLVVLRIYLVIAGQDYSTNGDNAKALEYYKMYVNTGKADLFADALAETAKKNNGVADENLYEVARVSAYLSFQEKHDLPAAMHYADIFGEDKASEKDAINLKLYFIENTQMESKADSVRTLGQLNEMAKKYPEDVEVFSRLATWYGNLGYTDKQTELIEARIAKDPKCFMAWAIKGQNQMNTNQYKEAIASFDGAIASPAEPLQYALVQYMKGFCFAQLGNELETPAEQKPFFEKAASALEESRKLDPEESAARWKYLLYQCYYHLYGENDARTKELESGY